MRFLRFLIVRRKLNPLPKAPESPRVSVLDEIIRDRDWYRAKNLKTERQKKQT
jgi:hypothetical protein